MEMVKKLTIEVPDDIYEDLAKKSEELNTSVERLIIYALETVRHRRIVAQSGFSKDYFERMKIF